MNNRMHTAINALISLGIAVAVVVSWSRNHSIGLAILHGIFNWFYVLYIAVYSKGQ
jgi:hypothetical protein